MFFDNFITANVGGGLTSSVQRANDFTDRQHSTGGQLVSTIGAAHAQRAARPVRDPRAGARRPTRCRGPVRPSTSPASPIRRPDRGHERCSGFGFTQDVLQFNNSSTLLQGDHAFKAGIDVQHVADTRTSAPAAALHVPERRGLPGGARAAPTRSATRAFTQYFGLPDLEYNTNQYGLFVQDDWRAVADLKVLYGVRYDLYGVPDGEPNAPIATSQDVPDVEEQLRAARRRGVDDRRRRAVGDARQHRHHVRPDAATPSTSRRWQNDGTNARASATFTPTQVGAPAFPGRAQRRLRRAAEHRVDRRSGLQGRRARGRTTCSSSTR